MSTDAEARAVPWTVVALLPDTGPDALAPEDFAALVAALPLARDAAALHVMHLTDSPASHADAAASPVPALPPRAVWWHCHGRMPDPAMPGPETWLARCREALDASVGPDATAALAVLLPATPLGDELAARLSVPAPESDPAAPRETAVLGRCQELRAEGGVLSARRAALGGRLRIDVSTASRRVFAVIAPGQAHAHTDASSGKPELRELSLTAPLADPPAEPVQSGDGLPALEGAWLVVSGGRGVGGEAGFGLLREVALALGGTVGASLPAIDAGWMPVARQVGQSGKFVRPRVYLAVAISGTPQHMAGVSRESMVVAVNNDPEAAIFRLADVGIVGDFRDVLPALSAHLSARQAARGALPS
jgi:electron transfer flavoprotein alpha subunit